MTEKQDIVENLRTRAAIRRQIPGRKSVQEGKPDRIADLLDEAATDIEALRETVKKYQAQVDAAIAGWELSQQTTARLQDQLTDIISRAEDRRFD